MSGYAGPLSPMTRPYPSFPLMQERLSATGCSPTAGLCATNSVTSPGWRLVNRGELIADGAVLNRVDGFSAHISMLETLELLESRKQDYNGIARLGIEALELKIKGLTIKEIAQMYGVPSSHVGGLDFPLRL